MVKTLPLLPNTRIQKSATRGTVFASIDQPVPFRRPPRLRQSIRMNATGCVPTNAEVRLRHLTHEQLVQIALIGMQNDKRLVEKVNRMLTREGELSRASVFENADLLENVFKQMKLCENNACGVSMLWRHKWMDAHTVRWVRECVEMSNDERHLSICSRLQPSSTGSSAAMFPSRWGKICKEDAPLQYHNSHFFSPNFINHVSDMAFSSTSGSVYLCCQARIFVCTQPGGADQTALLEKEHELVEHVGDAEITQLLVDEAKGYLYVVVQDRIKDGDFVEILNLETLSGVATLVKPKDEKCIHSIALVQGNLWLCDAELDCITIYEWNDDTQTYKMPTIITPPSIFSAYRDYNWQHWHAPHFVCCAEVEDEARVFLVELEEYTNHEEEAITEWETAEDRSALLKYGSEKRHNTIGHRSSRIVVMDTGGRLIRNINIAALVPQAVLSRMPGSKFCSAAMVVSTEDKQIYLYATVRRTRQSFQDVNDAVTILKVAEASRGALCR